MSQRKNQSTRLNSLPRSVCSGRSGWHWHRNSTPCHGCEGKICWPSRLDALHTAVRLRPPQEAKERLGLRPVERDHVSTMVGRPGLPVLDHPQPAVSRLLLYRHELRHLRRGPAAKWSSWCLRDTVDFVGQVPDDGERERIAERPVAKVGPARPQSNCDDRIDQNLQTFVC